MGTNSVVEGQKGGIIARNHVFIDGQNVGTKIVDQVLEAIGELGMMSGPRRFYLSLDQHKKLSKTQLQDFDEAAFEVISVNCLKGKNSVDIRIAVDAIEQGCSDGSSENFIFVTNDSDFTHVTSRLISFGKNVHLFTTKEIGKEIYSRKVLIRNIAGSKPASVASQTKAIVEKVIPATVATVARKTVAKLTGTQTHEQKFAALNRAAIKTQMGAGGSFIVHSDKMFRAFKIAYGLPWNFGSKKRTPQEFIDDFFGLKTYRFVKVKGTVAQGDGVFVHNLIARTARFPNRPREVIAGLGCDHTFVLLTADVIAKFFREDEFDNFTGPAFTKLADLLPKPAHVGQAMLNLVYDELGRPEGGSRKQQLVEYDSVRLVRLFYSAFHSMLTSGEIKIETNPQDTEELKSANHRLEQFLSNVREYGRAR